MRQNSLIQLDRLVELLKEFFYYALFPFQTVYLMCSFNVTVIGKPLFNFRANIILVHERTCLYGESNYSVQKSNPIVRISNPPLRISNPTL